MNEQEILSYIEKHLKEDLTLEQIAAAAGYSRYHFSRKFREMQGVPVMKYVLRRRLAGASEEILRGRSILETALDYGFASHSSFSAIFRREMGYHPSLLKMKKEIAGGMRMEQNETMTKEELYRQLSEKCTGQEYITHPLSTALLLAETEAEEPVVLAGLFCDWYKKGAHTESLPGQLPPKVRRIVEELPAADPKSLSDEALLVRTAERLHNMRTIEYMKADIWKKKAEETMPLLDAVNARIGKSVMTEELRGLAIKYLKDQTGAQ